MRFQGIFPLTLTLSSGLPGARGILLETLLLSKRSNPDVAELDGGTVLLENNRAFLHVHRCRCIPVRDFAEYFRMVLNHDAIIEKRQVGRLDLFAVLNLRSGKENVETLPLSRLACRIDQRRKLPVKCARISIGVNETVVRFDDLNFDAAEQHDATVAPVHAVLRFRGRFPFDMQLAIAEFVRSRKLAGCENVERAVFDAAFFRGVIASFPAVKVGSVEKNDCVRRGRLAEIAAARLNLRRLRAGLVVNLPFRTGNQRRIRVTGCILRRKGGGNENQSENNGGDLCSFKHGRRG